MTVSRTFTLSDPVLHLPLLDTDVLYYVSVTAEDGNRIGEFYVGLTPGTPDFRCPLYLGGYEGQAVTLSTDDADAPADLFAGIVQGGGIEDRPEFYPDVYLSPWDMHEPTYGQGKPYDDHFCAQLTELLTEYSPLFSVWSFLCLSGEISAHRTAARILLRAADFVYSVSLTSLLPRRRCGSRGQSRLAWRRRSDGAYPRGHPRARPYRRPTGVRKPPSCPT